MTTVWPTPEELKRWQAKRDHRIQRDIDTDYPDSEVLDVVVNQIEREVA